jgi:hypothetical protein
MSSLADRLFQQFGRLTHYAFDAVLCESSRSIFTARTESKLTLSSLKSLRLPGRRQALHWPHVNTTLPQPSFPQALSTPLVREAREPQKKSDKLTELILRAPPSGRVACGTFIAPVSNQNRYPKTKKSSVGLTTTSASASGSWTSP